jgi:hypothetical protein
MVLPAYPRSRTQHQRPRPEGSTPDLIYLSAASFLRMIAAPPYWKRSLSPVLVFHAHAVLVDRNHPDVVSLSCSLRLVLDQFVLVSCRQRTSLSLDDINSKREGNLSPELLAFGSPLTLRLRARIIPVLLVSNGEPNACSSCSSPPGGSGSCGGSGAWEDDPFLLAVEGLTGLFSLRVSKFERL